MKEKILIVPGNPCASYFYTEWAKEITKANPHIEVHFDIFPIFDMRLSPTDYLDKMIGHYTALLDSLYDGEPIHVIGHSIGGYLALKLLERNELKVKKLSLIFPFLGTPEKLGGKILKAGHYFSYMKPLAAMVIKFKSLLIPICSEARFVTKEELKNSLAFVRSEYLYFKDYELNEDALEKLKDKIHFLHNNRDIWCSKLTTLQLKAIVPSTYVDSCHEFIISKDEREKLTKAVF